MIDTEFKTAAEIIMEKNIQEKLNEFDLKESQCKGGREAWIAERKAALSIAHHLMKKNHLDFSEASKTAWHHIIMEREKPCDIKIDTELDEETGVNEEADDDDISIDSADGENEQNDFSMEQEVEHC